MLPKKGDDGGMVDGGRAGGGTASGGDKAAREKDRMAPAEAADPTEREPEISDPLITQTVITPLKEKEKIFGESNIHGNSNIKGDSNGPIMKAVNMEKMDDVQRKVESIDRNSTAVMEVDMLTMVSEVKRDEEKDSVMKEVGYTIGDERKEKAKKWKRLSRARVEGELHDQLGQYIHTTTTGKHKIEIEDASSHKKRIVMVDDNSIAKSVEAASQPRWAQ